MAALHIGGRDWIRLTSFDREKAVKEIEGSGEKVVKYRYFPQKEAKIGVISKRVVQAVTEYTTCPFLSPTGPGKVCPLGKLCCCWIDISNSETLRKRKLCIMSPSGTAKSSYGTTEESEEVRGLRLLGRELRQMTCLAGLLRTRPLRFVSDTQTLVKLTPRCVRHSSKIPPFAFFRKLRDLWRDLHLATLEN